MERCCTTPIINNMWNTKKKINALRKRNRDSEIQIETIRGHLQQFQYFQRILMFKPI